MRLESVDDLNVNLTSNDTLNVSLSPQRNMNLVLGVPKVVNGTSDYEKLKNKPQIESIELLGNKSFDELGLVPLDADDLIEILN